MKYTKQEVLKKVKKAKSYKDFRINFNEYYISSLKLKCNIEIKNSFKRCYQEKQRNQIRSILKNYKNLRDFRVNNSAKYRLALKLNMSDEIKRVLNVTPKKYKWNKKTILKEAKKFKVKSHFRKKHSGMFKAAIRMGIIEEACSHMEKVGNHYYRMLYAFEFPDKSVYVGLTYNYNIRYNHHMKNNKIIIKKTNKMGHTFIMFNEKIHKDIIGKKENQLINKYKNNGWKTINKSKGGALGGKTSKRKKDDTIKKLKKYKTKMKLKEKDKSLYYYALRTQDPDIKKEYKKLKNYFKSWNKNLVIEEAKKYNKKMDFIRKSPGAYNYCRRNNILDEIYRYIK